MFQPARLVFAGGGTRCLIYMQALVELERAGRLGRVGEYWGTSAGALLASLLAIGRSPTRVKDVLWGADFTKFRDIDVTNLLGIMNTWGLDDGARLTGEIERLFEVLETGSSMRRLCDISGLHIVVSDLTLHETVVCNAVSYPTLRIVDVVRASMTLPLFFRPFRSPIDGHIFVDGAVRAHFPWDVLPSDEARRDALGFSFQKSWIGGPKSFTEYIFSMIHFDEPKKIASQKRMWGAHILWFPSPPFPAWYVRFSDADFRMVDAMSTRTYEEWLTRAGDLEYPPKTSESLPPSVRPCTPPQTCPERHTAERSGNPQASLERPQDSFPHLSPRTSQGCRRWSL